MACGMKHEISDVQRDALAYCCLACGKWEWGQQVIFSGCTCACIFCIVLYCIFYGWFDTLFLSATVLHLKSILIAWYQAAHNFSNSMRRTRCFVATFQAFWYSKTDFGLSFTLICSLGKRHGYLLFNVLVLNLLWWKHQRLWGNSPNLGSHEQTDRWAGLLTDYQQVSQPHSSSPRRQTHHTQHISTL